MKCLKCNSNKLIEQNARFTPEIKGEVVEVIVPCMMCKDCMHTLMTTEQMTVLRRVAADKYKELHGLLTSSQIIAYREALGMSQSAFARYLNVGEASIKRWETYYIQDASQDELMRLKCDEASAEMNFLGVYWKRHEADTYSGNKKFNLQLFKNVALFLVEETKESIIYLNKFHFYIDFLHFKNHNTGVTGARYAPLKYGPCPDQYRAIYAGFISKGYLKETKNSYKNIISPDLNLFDDNERKTLEQFLKLYQKLGANQLYKLSHEEKGYQETDECGFISYKFADDLLV